ncbi:DUF2764 family protein [Legionella parisiensis]|uniref:Uncharacterized protein n=1 Tax=Legionella parisiensis TaxID=45071 RepID=A0A1E5JNT1_9GAMM|nr:DUF2764 family protein [Legionella parisiensis]KTD43632.1 V-type ATP synthase subunit A [Legionella parisiensis]OEH46013.1 hypothetical protein lpari_02991 [Legionella parisiensis]STX76744.1 V-type ATP synthase subunit A [Legionella parisiensis]
MNSQYYSVVCSLPRLKGTFQIQETPISRLQLEKRLKLLPLDKYKLALTVEDLVWTSWFIPKKPLRDLRNTYQNILKNESHFIIDLTLWFFDLRSILAALRLRDEKKGLPDRSNDDWITRWDYKLVNHWNELDFGLKAVYPWLPKIATDIAKKDTIAVEKFLLTSMWKYLSISETGHYFDFEAIIIYLLKWNIVHYWAGFNERDALNHINDLSQSLLNKQLSNFFILRTKGACHER